METCAISAYAYLQGADPWDPRASAVFGDYSDLPPMLIHCSEDENYYDDALRIAAGMRDTNCDLTMRIWESELHTWQFYGGLSAEHSVNDICQYIHRIL